MIVGVRRHFPVGHSQLNQWSPRPNLIIVAELHRTDTTFAMTNHAILIDDSTHFAVVSHLMVCLGYGLGLKPKQSKCGQAKPCSRSFHASLSFKCPAVG